MRCSVVRQTRIKFVRRIAWRDGFLCLRLGDAACRLTHTEHRDCRSVKDKQIKRLQASSSCVRGREVAGVVRSHEKGHCENGFSET